MSDKQKMIDDLKVQIEVWREELNIPGTSVGISIDDEEFTFGSGVTSADNPLDANDETFFQIGSITKTMTATAMMRLVEDGKLDLNAPIQQYLPDFRVKDETVSKMATVKHLITHSAGWKGDVFTDTGTNDDSLAEYVRQMADLDQLAPPDLVFSYNNSAFCTAGRIIEIVTGKVYETAMRELLFEPLGLERSAFFPKDVMTYRFAVGHRIDDEQGALVQHQWPIPRASNPAGGVACTIKDLLAYGRFHLGDGSPILKSESMTMMQSPQFPINQATGSMGLAWFIGDIAGTKKIEHGGGTIGQISQLLIIPEHNFVFGMLTNADKGDALIGKVEKWVLKEFLNLEAEEPETYEVPVAELEPYVGLYSRDIIETNITLEDDTLILQMKFNDFIPGVEPPPSPPPAPLAMCGEDELIVTDGPMKDTRVEFIRGDDGEIKYLRLGLRINPRVS